MVRTVAIARPAAPLSAPLELLRVMLVYGCALALIAAGRALPF